MPGLTQEQIDTFDREGMLCIPNFLSQDDISQMLVSARKLLSDLDMDTHPKTQFRTSKDNHVGDQYFFDSSDKISYFFDTDAFDESGNLMFAKERAVNKIGHGLHMHSELFHRVTFLDLVKQIARDLNYEDPRVLQSMLIFKNPVAKDERLSNGNNKARDNEVPSHTDGSFLFTRPQSALGFWLALEDCTTSNGCLAYNPGSHKVFPITKRFVKVDGGSKGCNFMEVEYSRQVPEDRNEDYRIVECKAGSLILIHNSVLHKSEKNNLDKSRYAYAFHLIDGTSEYDELNWLQVPPSGGTNFLKLYQEDAI